MAIILLLLIVVTAVGWPMLTQATARADDHEAGQIEDLLARRNSIYAQIRELEMDKRTGKLEAGEFREQDRRLRAEAIEILRELDALGATEIPAPGDGEDAPPSSEDDAEAPRTATLRSP